MKNSKCYIWTSRAYFYAKSIRPTYIKLPAEDTRSGEPGVCGKLMSMYGTRDAALNWAEAYTSTLKNIGFRRGVGNPCLYYNERTKLSILVHGDDFVAVGDSAGIYKLQKDLANVYKSKSEVVGMDKGEKQEVRILNRVIRRSSTGYHIEADPRHVEQVIKDLEIEKARPSRLPGSKELMKKVSREDTVDDRAEDQEEIGIDIHEISKSDADHTDLSPAEAKIYRAVTARLNYLATDRPDIQYAVKEAARCMASPHKCDWNLVDKIGRYLLQRPRVVLNIPWQK